MTRQSRPSLRHDAAWAMAGALAQTTSQATTMLALAQVAPVRTVGHYALGLAVAAPLNVFADRAVRLLQATAGDDDFPLRDYLALRTLVGLGAMAASALIVGLFRSGAESLQIVLLVAAARLVEGIAQTLYGRFQRCHQMRHIGRSQVLRSLLTTGTSLTCLFVWRRLDVALAAGVAAQALVLWHFDRSRMAWLGCALAPSGPRPSLRRRCVTWASMLRLALPLALSTFLVSLSGNLPRVFLSRLEDETVLGVFAILCYLCLPATIVVSALLQAATPRLADCYREDSSGRYLRLVRRLTLACGSVAVANATLIVGLGPTVLQMTLSDEYTAAAAMLGPIVAAFGVGFVATVPATAIAAQRWFRTSLLTCSLSCATALIASAALIPPLGMAGAAWAMLLSSGIHWLVSWLALRTTLARHLTVSAARAGGAIVQQRAGRLGERVDAGEPASRVA